MIAQWLGLRKNMSKIPNMIFYSLTFERFQMQRVANDFEL